MVAEASVRGAEVTELAKRLIDGRILASKCDRELSSGQACSTRASRSFDVQVKPPSWCGLEEVCCKPSDCAVSMDLIAGTLVDDLTMTWYSEPVLSERLSC